jgi:hypothetical protein
MVLVMVLQLSHRAVSQAVYTETFVTLPFYRLMFSTSVLRQYRHLVVGRYYE